jgi:hypothetical protein
MGFIAPLFELEPNPAVSGKWAAHHVTSTPIRRITECRQPRHAPPMPRQRARAAINDQNNRNCHKQPSHTEEQHDAENYSDGGAA